jgi:proline iminopeptidase
MIIRGIWTGTQAETENGYGGHTVRQFFPEAVARMEAAIPANMGQFDPQTLLKIFVEGDDALVKRVGTAWIQYAIKTGKLHATVDEVRAGFGDFDVRPAARIDCHYAANRFFLEEGQLLRDADRIKDIPVTIINGRYDMCCPPITAWRLHRRLPNSELIIVEEAGHFEDEPGIKRALVQAVAGFE